MEHSEKQNGENVTRCSKTAVELLVKSPPPAESPGSPPETSTCGPSASSSCSQPPAPILALLASWHQTQPPSTRGLSSHRTGALPSAPSPHSLGLLGPCHFPGHCPLGPSASASLLVQLLLLPTQSPWQQGQSPARWP